MIYALNFLSDAENTAIRPWNAIIRLIEWLKNWKFLVTKAYPAIFSACNSSLRLANNWKFFEIRMA